jgi:hypothetical protein
VPAAPEAGAVNARVPGEATASPDPLSVMMILPVEGMVFAGVRVTVMVTPPAPLTALLRVTAGLADPSVLAFEFLTHNIKYTQIIDDKFVKDIFIIFIFVLLRSLLGHVLTFSRNRLKRLQHSP